MSKNTLKVVDCCCAPVLANGALAPVVTNAGFVVPTSACSAQQSSETFLNVCLSLIRCYNHTRERTSKRMKVFCGDIIRAASPGNHFYSEAHSDCNSFYVDAAEDEFKNKNY